MSPLEPTGDTAADAAAERNDLHELLAMGVVVDKVAHAILRADHPEASGWSGKHPEVKDRYRGLARAAIGAVMPFIAWDEEE